MEPIIPVSDAATARIRAKEAIAAQQYQHVRRALEGDVARANQDWGGYFDLHKDNLKGELRDASEGFDEIDRLCAQFVYSAHASEYRAALRDPKALEPVLAQLRDSVIKEYGEKVRAEVQSLEAQHVAGAWNEPGCPQAPEGATPGCPPANASRETTHRSSTGGMLVLPKLPGTTQRKLDLEWQDLIEDSGFDGAHLKWHASSSRRREAARPSVSLEPPPLRADDTYYWEERPVSYDEWLTKQNEAWRARQNTPEVIDSIGIAETTALCKKRFPRIVSEYRTLWATEGDARTEVFADWLKNIQALVISECRTLWTGEWHSGWFTRACESKIATALSELARQEVGRVRRLEIKHLENSHLSLAAIVATDGNLDLALIFDRNSEGLCLARATLGRLEQARVPERAIACHNVAPADNEAEVTVPDVTASNTRLDLAREQQPIPPGSQSETDSTEAPQLGPSVDLGFASEAERSSAVDAYTEHWTCSEASLARTARVDPADLSKWKTGGLPAQSEKIARIEDRTEK